MIDPREAFADALRSGETDALTTVYQAAALQAQQTREHVLESAELADAVIAAAEAKIAAQRPDAWARSGDEVMRHLRGDVSKVFTSAVFAPANPVGHTVALISQALDALDDPSRPTPSNDQPLSEWDQIRASQRDYAASCTVEYGRRHPEQLRPEPGIPGWQRDDLERLVHAVRRLGWADPGTARYGPAERCRPAGGEQRERVSERGDQQTAGDDAHVHADRSDAATTQSDEHPRQLPWRL